MFPYWLLFSIFAAGAIEYRRRAPIGSQAAPFLATAALLMALMIGLRYQVGGDWGAYEEIYFYISYMDLVPALRSGDPGYAALNWLADEVGAGMWLVNLICGLIFTWGLIRFARRMPNPWLAVVVAIPYLTIVVAMGYSRQGVAIGIVLAGLSVLDRSTILRFSGYIIFAAAFHKSAVIVLPLVALAAARNRFVVVGLLFVLALMLYYFFVQSSFDRMVAVYVDQSYNSQGAAIRLAMNIVPAAIFIFFRKRFGFFSVQQDKLWRNFSFAAFATLIMLYFTEGSAVVDRLALYLIPLQLAVLSSLPSALGARGRASGEAGLLVIAYSALIQFVWLNYATHSEFWLPYKIYPLFGDA